jgi:hypothetical protein
MAKEVSKVVTIGGNKATYDIYNETTLTSNSQTGFPTQYSVKTYADAKAAVNAAAVAANTVLINANSSAISANGVLIAANSVAISANSSAISANGVLIAANTTSIGNTKTTTIDFGAASADYTLSGNELLSRVLYAISAGASANIIGPAVRQAFILVNNSGKAITLKKAAGTGVAVANGDMRELVYGLSDYVALTSAASA